MSVCLIAKVALWGANAAWRMDQSNWQKSVQHWINHASPKDILNSDIFFDARPVHGITTMVDDLRNMAIKAASGARNFLLALEHNATNFKNQTGVLGRIKTKEGRVDLKLGGILPIFSAARVLSLKHGITERDTLSRLNAVVERNPTQKDIITDLLDAHKILLRMILNQQLQDIIDGIPLSNSAIPKRLSSHELDELKWALGQVPRVRDLFGRPMA